MQGNAADIFKEPAIKLLCKQLKDCQQVSTSSEQTAKRWLVPLKSSATGKEVRFPVHTVWIQGTIITIISESLLILKDLSGGIIKIPDYNGVTGVSDWISRGVYCSVIGNIVSSTQTPVINALKMNKLDNKHDLDILWEWEVKDLADELCDGCS